MHRETGAPSGAAYATPTGFGICLGFNATNIPPLTGLRPPTVAPSHEASAGQVDAIKSGVKPPPSKNWREFWGGGRDGWNGPEQAGEAGEGLEISFALRKSRGPEALTE